MTIGRDSYLPVCNDDAPGTLFVRLVMSYYNLIVFFGVFLFDVNLIRVEEDR